MPEELKEKDFIHEGNRNPFPLWMVLLILVAILGFLWTAGSWLIFDFEADVEKRPFLRVTNREFSVFLWQHSEYMPPNVKGKSGYLPGFHRIQKVTPKAEEADKFVTAPPDILFRYHTWKRLIGDDYVPRPIPLQEFKDFLKYDEQWQPKYWPNAPEDYAAVVENLDTMSELNLQQRLPLIVKQAFQGWKVYFREGDRVNQIDPTVEEMQAFLATHPHYARNYWRNLYPDYLKSLTEAPEGSEKNPPEDLTPFLRFAYYLYSEGQRVDQDGRSE